MHGKQTEELPINSLRNSGKPIECKYVCSKSLATSDDKTDVWAVRHLREWQVKNMMTSREDKMEFNKRVFNISRPIAFADAIDKKVVNAV